MRSGRRRGGTSAGAMLAAGLLALSCSSAQPEPASASPAADAAGLVDGDPETDAGQGQETAAVDAQDSATPGAMLPALSTQAQQTLAAASQLIAVVTPAWSDPSASIALFVRDGQGWALHKGPWDAQVGSKGLSWGRGLTQPPAEATRVKVEGDKTAPAGLFRLGGVMGYAAQPPDGLNVPYQQATASVICVDDPKSIHYNRIVDTSAVTKDWDSYENMLRTDNLYSLLALIDHNGLTGTPAPVPSGGSCIFMHLWSGPGHPTIGCTAFDGSSLTELLVALESLDKVVLAQLPSQEYAEAVKAWNLPAMGSGR